MSRPHVQAVWEAPDRAAALAAATDAHGEDGSTMRGEITGVLPPSDLALFGDPAWMKQANAGFTAMACRGYTDDRLADGGGWVTFDVRSIRCPVTVLHGGSDRMVDVIHAHHTAEVVPGAELVIFDDYGHFSIVNEACRRSATFCTASADCSARQRTRWCSICLARPDRGAVRLPQRRPDQVITLGQELPAG